MIWVTPVYENIDRTEKTSPPATQIDVTVDVRELKDQSSVTGIKVAQIDRAEIHTGDTATIQHAGQVVVVVGQAPALKITPPPESSRPPSATTFVGRQAELADFAHRLATHHVVVIAGFPGMGKTALAVRLAERATTNPNKVFWHQFHVGEGIEPVIRLLAGFLYHNGRPGLWEMLEGTRLVGGQPHSVEVMLDYLVPLLRGQAFLLCLDDFHLAEEDSLVEKAMTRLKALSSQGEISLIVTSRRVTGLVLAAGLAPLPGLSLFDTRELLADRSLDLPDDLLEALHRRTEGNAQLLTLAAEALRQAHRPAQVVERLVEEKDVENFLLEEVDKQLNEVEKTVMGGVATLLGYPGTRHAIEATLASGSLLRTVRYLANRFLLLEQTGTLDREYLEHAMVQAFYYGDMDRRERQDRHRRAGEYYEREEPDVLRAAMHYQAAGEHARAAELATADIWALINRGQARLLRSLLTSLSQQTLGARLGATVQLALGEVLVFSGEVHPAQAAYQAALSSLQGRVALAESGNLEARACMGLGTLLAHQAPEEALRWLDRGLAAVSRNTPLLQAALYNRGGTVLVGLAEYQAAIAALRQALVRLPDTPGQLRGNVLTNLGTAHAWASDTPQGSRYTAQALEISRVLHDTYGVLSIVNNIGIDKEISGDWAGAAADYQHALALAEQLGSRSAQARIHNLLGTLRLHQGDDAAAEDHVLRAIGLFRQVNNPEYLAATLPILAQLHLRRQEWEAARTALTEAEALVNEGGWDYILPETFTVQARLFLAEANLSQAQERVDRAIAVAGELGQAIDEGKAWRVKGMVSAAAGQVEDALSACEHSLALLTGQDPYETALTQLLLARMLATDNAERSAELRNEAETTLQRLGADIEP